MKRIGMLGALLLATLGMLLCLGAPAQATWSKDHIKEAVTKYGYFCHKNADGTYSKIMAPAGSSHTDLEKIYQGHIGHVNQDLVPIYNKGESNPIWQAHCVTTPPVVVTPEPTTPPVEPTKPPVTEPTTPPVTPEPEPTTPPVEPAPSPEPTSPPVTDEPTTPPAAEPPVAVTPEPTEPSDQPTGTPDAPINGPDEDASEEVTPITPTQKCVDTGTKYYAQVFVGDKSFDSVSRKLKIDNITYELHEGKVVTAVADEGYKLVGKGEWHFSNKLHCYHEAVPGVTVPTPAPTAPDAPAEVVTPVTPVTPTTPAAITPEKVAPTTGAVKAETTPTAAPVTAPEGQLANTGFNTTGLLLAGIVLIAGAALLFGARRYKNN